jgi:hypothetical protein
MANCTITPFGTLVQFADHRFVVTAAHAIEDFHRGREHYSDLKLFLDNGDGSVLVPLYGKYFATEKYGIENKAIFETLMNATRYRALGTR